LAMAAATTDTPPTTKRLIKGTIKPPEIKLPGISPPFRRSNCLNETTIMGDDVMDQDLNGHLYVTESKYCFNPEVDLLPMFQTGDLKNPYTRLPFTSNEIKGILEYPHMTASNRALLRNILEGGLSADENRVIGTYPEVFLEIYRTGYICYIDHSVDYDYPEDRINEYGIDSVRLLEASIYSLPEPDRDAFYNMKTGDMTLRQLIDAVDNANISIHAVGIRFIKIFMRKYHQSQERPDVSGLGIISLAHDPDISELAQRNAYILCFNTRSSLRYNLTMLYIYDEPTSGNKDYASYFVTIYPTGNTSMANERRPTDLWQLSVWNSVGYKYDGGDGGVPLNMIIDELPSIMYVFPRKLL
jgi:hypothetical protein